MKKIILTDADGVILDWEYAFDVWMQQHGFQKQDGGQLVYSIGKRYGIDMEQGKKLIKIFNESAAIGFLPPLRDAMYYIKRLHEKRLLKNSFIWTQVLTKTKCWKSIEAKATIG